MFDDCAQQVLGDALRGTAPSRCFLGMNMLKHFDPKPAIHNWYIYNHIIIYIYTYTYIYTYIIYIYSYMWLHHLTYILYRCCLVQFFRHFVESTGSIGHFPVPGSSSKVIRYNVGCLGHVWLLFGFVCFWCFGIYPMVNKQLDPENHQFLMETSLPTPICQGLC